MKFRILLLFCLLSSSLCPAKERQLIFRSFNADNGLAHNTVLAVIQDRTGFMWFGTKDGLNRYDGSEIRTVAVTDAIPGNNYISALCEDNKGCIWIGTDSGVCLYDPETERANRFLLKADDGSRITENIPQIVLAPDSTVWIAAGSQGFFRYDSGAKTLTRIPGDKTGRKTYSARNICFTAQNAICITLDDGNIYLSEDNLASVTPLFPEGGGTEAFRNRYTNRLVSGAFNKMYACTSLGLFEINLAAKRFRKIDLPHSNNYVRDLLILKNDEFWVATESALEILDGNLREAASLYGDHRNPYALQTNSLYCLYKDKEDNVWIGTYFAGVAYTWDESITSIRRYYANSEGCDMGYYIREIVPDEDGNLWIGTESQGLTRLDQRLDNIVQIPIDENGNSCNIHGLCCDGDFVWVGTYEQTRSLVRIHRRTLASKSYPSAGKEIYTICRTSGGELWIGTTSGLKRYDRAADRFVSDSAIRSHVYHIREDSFGNIWAATYSDGLYKYDAMKDAWRHYLYAERDTASLAANKVLSVFEDSRSRIWLTTEGGGLCRYDSEADSFVRYKSRLPFDTCYRIEEDAQGVFWITSNKGLIRFDAEALSYYVFTTDDGLLNNQFNYSSLCKTEDGRIYAGSSDGFISFDPAKLKPYNGRFPIVLTDFMPYNKSIGAGSDSLQAPKSITHLDRIDLAPDENSFSVRVAAISYRSPNAAHMRYKLEGFDSEWHRVSNNTISYSNLPFRSYRLVVEGLDSKGAPNGIARSLEIRIRPPFYLSGIAYACYAALALTTVVLLYRLANRRTLRKRETEIEKIERSKERELYVAKFDFFTNIAHEIRTPLSLIRGPLENIVAKTGDSPDRELHEELRTMQSNTDRLTTLINQLLDFRKAEQQGFRLHPVECDVREAVENVCLRFVTMARQKHIDFAFELPAEKLQAAADKEALTKIVSNLLSNALKYAQSYARLKMTVENDPARFRVAVVNDGPVVPEGMREKIFLPFVQYRDGKHVIAGTGIGLTLARSLAELHGGTLIMDPSTEINRFVLTVPVVHQSAGVRTEEPEIAPGELRENTTAPQDDASKKPALLIVEDDPEMQAFIVRHMAPAYRTVTADNGRMALERLAKNEPFDLILSDVMMPEMDGFELCRRVKADLQYSHIPVLLLTAKTDVASKVEGLGTGADIYVEKPFSLEYLRASISALLSNRELVRRHFLESPFAKSETLTYSKADENFMCKLDQYIMQHLEQAELSVKEMAEEMCMSSSNLFRKLKAITGKSPNEYLRIKRLKKAAELLQQNEYGVTEISLLVGFSSSTYFSSCFKKQFGITPTDFREGEGKG
ncbi:hybrid sensor histidine kinase/response regulator transcription factor [Alistipes timonensis]|uniref:hybrid sensor histidine kinase/response regulator transcription factor n=1 Tax=Alistipes timonensis TaxID=1465754 RepID=UPI00214BBB63|nr:hybrid sensor histidine kinase/response regulator transcription factor [Alistipes timonensis]MCR2031878.1 response regulator [Alistipes timonensis]